MAGHLAVETEQLLANRQGTRLDESEADVVAERADISHMVVHALQLEEQRAKRRRLVGHVDPACLLDRQAVGEVVADGAVAGHSLRERDSVVDVASLEELLDATVREPEPCLHFEDRLADDREAEVSRLDETRVDRSDRNLIDAGTLHPNEREGPGVSPHRRRRTCVVQHRVPSLWPMLMEDQRTEKRMSHRDDPEQVVHRALEATRGEREVPERGN